LRADGVTPYPAIENGYFQRELARAAYRHQMELESGKGSAFDGFKE